MKSKLAYIVIILLFIIALIGTGCGQLGSLGNSGEPQSAESTDSSGRVPPPASEPTAVPNTEVPAAAPARVPPPVTEQTAVSNAEAAAPVANTSNIERCKLPSRPIDDPFDYQHLGIPRHSGFMPSAGTVEIAVLFADFSDARANSSPEEELALLNPTAASELLREASYGELDLVIKPFPSWLTMSQPAAHYVELADSDDELDELAIYQEIVALADPNFDFSNTDLVLLISNPQASEGLHWPYIFSTAEDSQGIQADGTTIRSGITVGGYLRDPENEEVLRNNIFARWLGVTMTLMYHGFRDEILFPDLTDEERRAATGSFGILGNARDNAHAPGHFAFERWQLGWLEDEQIFCQTAGEETTELAAIEQVGGIKAVMIPICERTALVVESRKAMSTDQDLTKEGALVYTVDTSVEPDGAPIRVLPAVENDLMRDQSPLAQGESFTYQNITVTNMESRADGDSVRVSISGPIQCPQAGAGQPAGQTTGSAAGGQCVPLPVQVPQCSTDGIPAPSQADVMVRFVNQTGFDGIGFWQDDSQSPAEFLEYFNVPEGQKYDQETFEGDKWVVREPGGATLLEYTASDEQKQCVVVEQPTGALWLDFVNNSGVPGIGFLVRADGTRVEYFRVGIGGTTGIWTAAGDVWGVFDSCGNVLLEYTATSANPQQVLIPLLVIPEAPTYTPEPLNTAAPTSTPAPVNTAVPTNTPAPVNTAVPTNTPAPADTAVPTVAPTNTPMPVPTNTAVPTPTETAEEEISLIVTNNTDEPYSICNQAGCGLLFPGDSSSPTPTIAGEVWTFTGENSGDVQTYTATDAPNQTYTITPPNTPDPTLTITNNTAEPYTLCNQSGCGLLFPGDSSSPIPTFAGDTWTFTGENSGSVQTYVATDAPNQTYTISN